ncbi:hypothetical protein [Micromonospora sp. AKA38]|uniref:hypothetical protein n=1 Tax=Micromonospora sp. AKA38 TaxID=2733861 RepID=UPI0022C08AED|nr:hypothetical protein [Micromonospora sp. AKA38]GHJ16825.1 hypothetical protein TPA0908_48200 [Micromonospora sp. AKA38]
MTRPEEPTEALPTRALPADPARDEPTVHLVPPRPPVDADATAPLSVDPAWQPTAHLARPPAAADATAHLAGPAISGPVDGAPTVYLGSGTAGGAAPTVHFGGTAGGGEPTVHLTGPWSAGGQPTTGYLPTATGPTGPTAGAYRETTVDARAVSGVPTPPPGGELRFGPGVPATPPPAPAWPAAPPARPPRPVWRRVVSVLSTLLTAALLVTVGLYLWQRLRPLEIEQVAVAVPRPAGVACDVTVDVVATVRTNGRAGTIRYQWFRSDAPPGALLAERVGSGQRTATLTLRWTFSGVGATTGTATVNIVEPTPVQAGTRVSYRCPGG